MKPLGQRQKCSWRKRLGRTTTEMQLGRARKEGGGAEARARTEPDRKLMTRLLKILPFWSDYLIESRQRHRLAASKWIWSKSRAVPAVRATIGSIS